MTDRNKGILAIIISALGFAIMSAFVKLSGDIPTMQKALFRNAVSVIIAFGLVKYYGSSLFGKRESQKYLILRSTLGLLGVILYFYAIDGLVLSDAEMLNKLSPFFVIVFCAIFLREKIKPMQGIALAIAFIGCLFIIKPQLSLSIIPYMIGFLSSIFAAGAYTVVRVLKDKEEYYTVVFYFSFFSTVALLPFVVFNYSPMSTTQIIYLTLAGVFACIGQFGITLAYKFAPAKEISIFNYFTVVFSGIFSVILFDQIPDYLSIIGYIIIFASSLYMYIYNNKYEVS
ncbi:DMT family transporter [Clostridium cylindrosporum]|uniref:Carboxylate/amino acid/amine transporter n=1 Tax=Clostridium cylindrosporum DSM 605 TaxID=1121307 RepID=A0A0J8DD57_CLOCY|nr:DMT family transporter [Clostridium cylindrosporum]KMT22178.1 carboxylate/amino acid/amine transporter [Clostridium cylindrosporum DSM 605]